MKLLYENSSRLLPVNCFGKKLHHRCLIGMLFLSTSKFEELFWNAKYTAILGYVQFIMFRVIFCQYIYYSH